VRRPALVLLVALLTFSTSGAFALIVPEPCNTSTEAGQSDGYCPPTCPMCGCCAQAIEPVSVAAAAALGERVADPTPLSARLPATTPRDVLHVPKHRLA
jgi:hypothetical protein